MKAEQILDHLQQLYPNAHSELSHVDSYQLLVAVILSAQATDISVNKVTPRLFQRFPTIHELAQSTPSEVESIIQTIGLYRNKARMLVEMAQKVVSEYDGSIPSNRQHLQSLPGVGRKTANVVLSVWFKIPAIAVDTHVQRVSQRLKLAKEGDSVLIIETKLKRKFPRHRWNQSHHLMIFFGRYMCKARNPLCNQCPFTQFCKYYKTTSNK